MSVVVATVEPGKRYLALSSVAFTGVRTAIALVLGVSLAVHLPGAREATLVGACLVMLLDLWDGQLFERSTLNQRREWRIARRIVDSVADRIVVQALCLGLLASDGAFAPYYLLILAREVVFGGLGLSYIRRGALVYPGFYAKTSLVFAGLLGITYIALGGFACLVVAVVMGVLSLFAYGEYEASASSLLSAAGRPSRMAEPIVGRELVALPTRVLASRSE